MPKVEGENNCACESTESLPMPSRCNEVCGRMGLYGFVTAIGVGFVAYSATHMYVCFCAPSGVWGFVQSLVMMDSTFCQVLLGLLHHSQSLYGAMMFAFMFSLIGGLGKGVGWMTGTPAPEIPRNVQIRGIPSLHT